MNQGSSPSYIIPCVALPQDLSWQCKLTHALQAIKPIQELMCPLNNYMSLIFLGVMKYILTLQTIYIHQMFAMNIHVICYN